jgi:alcohol dehydrogenase class IV
MALPFCLAYNASADVEAIDQLALALSGGRYADLRSVAKSLVELNDRLGIAGSPQVAGIPRSELSPMARECVTKYPRPTNPVPMTDERVTSLYDAWFAGDLDAAWSV